MYRGDLITGLEALVERVEARRKNFTSCTVQDIDGFECGAEAVVQVLPVGDEARCRRHLDR
jgi:hypothetical protein